MERYTITVSELESLRVKYSFRMSLFGLLRIVFITFFFWVSLTVSTILFTPIKEYIPGYASTQMKRRSLDLMRRSDSLKERLLHSQAYIENLRILLQGGAQEQLTWSMEQREKNLQNSKLYSSSYIDSALSISKEDSVFRRNIESRTVKKSFKLVTPTLLQNLFIPPVESRYFTSQFDESHMALDIACQEGDVVKAISSAVVLLSEWTFDTGYVMILKHSGGVISIYKHNSALLKKQGDIVFAGDPIAISGTTGELSTGPHLHFELWIDGTPVDPMDYIPFD